jgi:hypothetical protein
VLYAKGCNIADQDKSGFPAAIAGSYTTLSQTSFIALRLLTEVFTAAKQANVVVAFLGLDQSQEVPNKIDNHFPVIQTVSHSIFLFLFLVKAEGLDRVNIDLPGVQNDLAKALYSANPNLIVVLINGGAVAIGNIDCFSHFDLSLDLKFLFVNLFRVDKRQCSRNY